MLGGLVVRRRAFAMRLKLGFETEYRKRHDEIWPELSALLKAAGIRDYSIFLYRKSGTLFAVQKLVVNNTTDDLPNHPIMKRWWAYMADIMETNPDNSPATQPLDEVFHTD
jgi:L-rhamnose mutarotase